MNSNGGSRVLIPTGIRKTIHDIKEIAAKHSDDDIYAMLQECNMDPNETAQRLLYLDTFQEVKKKRDIRKANVNNRVSEESRRRTGTQGRGFRGGRGHYYSSHVHHGAGSGMNVSTRKENGVNNCMERGYSPLPTTVPEKTEKKMTSSVTSFSSISVNGPTRMPNGSSDHERTLKLSSDPVAVPPLNSQNPAIEHEASNHRNASKSGATYPALNGPAAGYTIANSIQAPSGDVINAVLEESPSIERNESLEHSQQSQLIGVSEVVAAETTATLVVKDSSESLPAPNTSILEDAISKLDMKQEKLNTCGFQAVIFPDHLQVPEEIKNGLTFGSLDFEHSVNLCNGPDDSNGSLPAPELLHETEKAANETSLSNLNVSSTAREGDALDNQHSPPHVPENKVHLEDNVYSDAAPQYDHSKQEIMFSQGGPQYPFVHMGPNYGFPFVQPMLGSQVVRCEGSEPQSGNSTVSSTSATTQTDSQPTGVGQSSIALSPPPFPVFRQPYPYYFPYAPYFPSYYLASNAQQLLGPNGLPQRSSTGNIYLSPPSTVPGAKFSVPQGKPGINAPQFGVPSGYSSYGPSPAVNSAGNEEIAASGLKENGVYSTVQQGEGPPLLWVPAPGREILHANSFYNPLPQGQHVSFPPPPAGIYHPPQASPAATSIPHPHL